MERSIAQRIFNSKPVICSICNNQFPNYRMIIHKNDKLICFDCSAKDSEKISSIKKPYKEHYYQIIQKLPLPDYKIAKNCLDSITTLRNKVNVLMQDIRNRINLFQKDLEQFFEQTLTICNSYIQKVKNIQEGGMEGWHKHPPKLIDQQKYILNIKQKQQIACKIQAQLKTLKVNMPYIQSIKSDIQKNTHRTVCHQVSINCAINVRGTLYQGTNDGRIIYQNNFVNEQIKAHESLIRTFAHDGQFRLFSGSDDQTIKIWDIRNEQPQLLHVFGKLKGIKSFHRQLVVMQGGKVLASSRGQFDGYQIRIWNLETLENTKTFQGHTQYIRGMIQKNKNQLISVSQDRYLRIWNLAKNEKVGQYFHNDKIKFVYNNKNGKQICIVDYNNRVVLLDQDSLEVINGLKLGARVQLVSADTFIYVQIDRNLTVYNWCLDKIQKIDLELNFNSTGIIEMGNKLVITDTHGQMHEFFPICLQNSK